MLRKTVVLIAFAALAALAGCPGAEKTAPSSSAPDFTLPDLSGKKVRLADQKGKVVLIEFWATWCPPCRSSIPVIERLHRTYGGKGLVVLAISMDEGGWDKVKAFTAEQGITYSVLQGNDDVSTKYLVRMIPAVFLVDKQGNIAKQFIGGGSEADMEKEIKALL